MQRELKRERIQKKIEEDREKKGLAELEYDELEDAIDEKMKQEVEKEKEKNGDKPPKPSTNGKVSEVF
jgi:hypothetical protein